MTDQELNTVEEMEKYGGGFVKALAECLRRADLINFEKLKTTFPEYWVKYDEWAKKTTSECNCNPMFLESTGPPDPCSHTNCIHNK